MPTLTNDCFYDRASEIYNRFGDKAFPPTWGNPRRPNDPYAWTTWLIDRLRLTVEPPTGLFSLVLWVVKWRADECDEAEGSGFTLPEACLSLLEEWEGDGLFNKKGGER